MSETGGPPVLVSGGAGYIGSHVVHRLRMAGFRPVVLDSLVNGHAWATGAASAFRQGDIADAALIRGLCATYRPVAALHFAAFIEVGESVSKPDKYFENNRDKARIFFETLADSGVDKIVFSSTAAVYGDPGDDAPLTEDCPARPINPYGQSKHMAELLLLSLPTVRSVILRYFNVAGSEVEAGLGEAHFPETHLLPRMILPLIGTPMTIQDALGFGRGVTIFGDDHATRDGTAVRDYLHVVDLADAHLRALEHLLKGGANQTFNLGTGTGYSVKEIVQAVRDTLGRPDFHPAVVSRRAGDPATLVASSAKAQKILGWKPRRGISDMIRSAAEWHRGDVYLRTILEKADLVRAN